MELDIQAKNDPIVFPEWTPPELRELIEGMTAKDWRKRISIDEVLSSKWFAHP